MFKTKSKESIAIIKKNEESERERIKNKVIPYTKYLWLTVPYSATCLIVMGNNFICASLAARINKEVYAAYPLISSTQFFAMNAPSGFIYSASILIGNAESKKNYKEVGRIFRQGMLMNGIVAIPTMIFLSFSKQILIVFGEEQMLSNIAGKYFNAYIYCIPAMKMLSAEAQLALGTYHPVIMLASTFSYSAITSLLAYLFVFRTDLGVVGIGLANTISAWAVFFGTTAYFICNTGFDKYFLFRVCDFKNFCNILLQMLETGFPIGLQMLFEDVTLTVISNITGLRGEKPLLAYQVVLQFVSVFTAFVFGLAQGTGVAVSMAQGAKKFELASKLGYLGISASTIFSIGAVVSLNFLARPMISMVAGREIADDDEVVEMAKFLFIIQGGTLVLDYVRNLSQGALRGYKETWLPMVGCVIATTSSIGIGVCLDYFLDLGVYGLTAGRAYGLGIISFAMLTLWRFVSKKAIEDKGYKPFGIKKCFSSIKSGIKSGIAFFSKAKFDSNEKAKVFAEAKHKGTDYRGII